VKDYFNIRDFDPDGEIGPELVVAEGEGTAKQVELVSINSFPLSLSPFFFFFFFFFEGTGTQ
jgi:hypothetical protein